MDRLPEDILQIVFDYLEPRDFLHVCSISKAIHEQFQYSSYYWRNKASGTFRLPISPLLHADGARWFWLYKKLKTQTCLYTWGQGVKGNLGMTRGPGVGAVRGIRAPRRPHRPHAVFERTSSSWPTEVHLPHEIDVIVDVQCGGWSTTVLTQDGKLLSLGILDAADGRNIGLAVNQFTRLEYLTQSTASIRQFSSGRRHVLGLDDNGEVLSWDRVNEKGYKIYPRGGRGFGGKVVRVCAGWAQSSLYAPETGIIYWEPVANNQEDAMLDGVHVKEYVVPGTARHKSTPGDHDLILEVQKHILLEGYLVFVIGSSRANSETKLFACRIGGERANDSAPNNPVFEVPGYGGANRELRDLQGSFRKFAVFTATGEVLAGSTDYLNRCAAELQISPSVADETSQAQVRVSEDLLAARPPDVPALQHRGVIALAFGDYHYLALHADGKITAYGTDPQNVGALGLGHSKCGARFRGVRHGVRPMFDDGKLLPIAEKRGRQVWLEPEKKEWLEWLEKSATTGGETSPLEVLEESPDKQAAFSEWVEQEGRHWEDGPRQDSSDASTTTSPPQKQEIAYSQDYDGLGAYFAVAVTAAGWHSGAVVLVNSDKAEQTRQKWMAKGVQPRRMPGHFENDATEQEDEVPFWENQPFPRLRLPDGTEMPGKGEFVQWRDGVPSMRDLGLPTGGTT